MARTYLPVRYVKRHHILQYNMENHRNKTDSSIGDNYGYVQNLRSFCLIGVLQIGG